MQSVTYLLPKEIEHDVVLQCFHERVEHIYGYSVKPKLWRCSLIKKITGYAINPSHTKAADLILYEVIGDGLDDRVIGHMYLNGGDEITHTIMKVARESSFVFIIREITSCYSI